MHPIQLCIVSAPEIETRPRRRRAETVQRLLDAAMETFAEVGFDAASVEDICSRGGFTRGAFYSSFRTKDELFGALYVRETGRELARVAEQLTGIEAESDPVAAGVERCLSTFRADRTWVLVKTEYTLHAARHPEAAEALREHTAALHVQLTALIESTAARSGLTLAVPAADLARILLALHDGVVVHEVVRLSPDASEAPGPVPELERTALLLLLRAAIAAPSTD